MGKWDKNHIHWYIWDGPLDFQGLLRHDPGAPIIVLLAAARASSFTSRFPSPSLQVTHHIFCAGLTSVETIRGPRKDSHFCPTPELLLTLHFRVFAPHRRQHVVTKERQLPIDWDRCCLTSKAFCTLSSFDVNHEN